MSGEPSGLALVRELYKIDQLRELLGQDAEPQLILDVIEGETNALELLDEIGIWAQIVFPGVVGLGGQNLGELVTDVALRNLCLEIFNDANAELQAESGNRLLPMAILPAWDVDACVREVERGHASRWGESSDPLVHQAPTPADAAQFLVARLASGAARGKEN